MKEDAYSVSYTRYNKKKHKCTQCLDITYEEHESNFLIQSYNPNLFDIKGVGNACIGLSLYETNLCIKKMKQWMKKYNRK